MITITTTLKVPLAKVWECWNEPKHITQWCFASEDWHAPSATNDLKEGSFFTTRMEAKDGSFGFDLKGIYDQITPHQIIRYHLDDGRNVEVLFSENEGTTTIIEKFDPENQNPHEMQQQGWQAILDNFKKYVEAIC
jgi:uncharacterized protein YndB with AHSA1/START domain